MGTQCMACAYEIDLVSCRMKDADDVISTLAPKISMPVDLELDVQSQNPESIECLLSRCSVHFFNWTSYAYFARELVGQLGFLHFLVLNCMCFSKPINISFRTSKLVHLN